MSNNCFFNKNVVNDNETIYRAMFKNHSMVQLIIEPETSTIVDANEAACKFYGYTEKEIQGMDVSKINIFSDLVERQEILEELRLYDAVKCKEVKIHLRCGNIGTGQVSIDMVNFGGKKYYLAVINDVTELKRAQEKLIQTKEEMHQKEIEQKNLLLKQSIDIEKFRNEFFSNLSHELRTPLNLILSSLQIMDITMKYKTEDFGIDKLSKYMKIIKQNSYRLLRLINNLIDSTKMDGGFLEFHPVKCNIVNTVEDITLSIVEYAKEKNVNIIFDTDVEEQVISCDLDKIERIMLNLLSNALKFTPFNGKITVTIKMEKDFIIINVKDSGIGIPQDKIESIFLRFKQVDNLLTRKNEGSGIGLYLVKAFVEMHGGNISVRSKMGEGTEFIFTIPNRTLECEETIELGQYDMNDNKFVERAKIEFSDIYF